MKKQVLFDIFKTTKRISEVFGITSGGVSQWGDEIPRERELEFCTMVLPRLTKTNNLARFRERAGMRQQDLADACGIPKPILAGYEHGYITPTLEHINELVFILQDGLEGGCTITDVYPGLNGGEE